MYHILVVEDELSMIMGLRDNLEFEGYKVDIAQDGAKGYDYIKNNEYDLVLLDVMLPSISGFDICKKVRSEGITTPIMLLTAKGEEIEALSSAIQQSVKELFKVELTPEVNIL